MKYRRIVIDPPDEMREAFAIVERASDARRRCTSCDHLASMHSNGTCWFTVAVGRVGSNLVCPCEAQP